MAAKQVVIYSEGGGKYRLLVKHLRGEGRWTTRIEIKAVFKKHRAFIKNGYCNDREKITKTFEFSNGFDTTLGEDTLRIGCKVFSGVNFKKLRKWALAK